MQDIHFALTHSPHHFEGQELKQTLPRAAHNLFLLLNSDGGMMTLFRMILPLLKYEWIQKECHHLPELPCTSGLTHSYQMNDVNVPKCV